MSEYREHPPHPIPAGRTDGAAARPPSGEDGILLQFIALLRQSGLSIGSSETMAATRATALVGYSSRAQLHSALSCCLLKRQRDQQTFDRLFARFFRDYSPANENNAQSEQGKTSSPAEELADALKPLTTPITRQRRQAVELAAQRAGIGRLELSTQRNLYRHRIQRELNGASGPDSSAAQTGDASTTGGPVRGARDDPDVAALVEREYALHGTIRAQARRARSLQQTAIDRLDARQLQQCRDLIRRMVQQLPKQSAQAARRSKRGQLNVHATLRHSLATDAVPFHTHWRCKQPASPQLFVLCDVSSSVKRHAELMLLFTLCMKNVLPRSRCFAFSNQLAELCPPSPDQRGIETCLIQALQQLGGSATDYAQALNSFDQQTQAQRNRQSTIVILGDARNSHAEPRADLVQQFAKQTAACYWLNPEPKQLWNTGDSVMAAFADSCRGVFELNTLTDLETFCRYIARGLLSWQ